MATIGLGFTLSANASKMAGGVNEAVKALDKVGDAAKKTARDVSVLKTIEIGKLIGSGISQLANAFTDAARGALSYAQSVAGAIDATQDLANRTGIGVEALQSLQVAAKLGGVDDVTAAFDKLTVAIGKAGESGDTGAFDRLGLNFEQLRSMSPEEQFRAIAAAISALPGEAERAAAAVAIFGKSGAQLVPFLSNLGAIEERARNLGIVLSEQQVGNIAGMNDALDLVSKTFDGIIGQVVGNLSPAITAISEQFLQFVESFNGGGTGLADAITGALFDGAEQLASVFDSFSAGFSEWMESMGGFEGALKATGEYFSAAANTFMAVTETLRAVFNLFELAGNAIALYFGNFIQNLGYIFRSQTAQDFGKEMARAARENISKNSREMESAAGNAATAAGNAIAGTEGGPSTGPAGTAVAGARAAFNDRNNPEAKSQRDQAAAKKESDRWWEGSQRRAAASMKKQADEAKKKADDEAKAAAKLAAEQEKAAAQKARAEEKAAADAQRAAEKQAQAAEKAAADAQRAAEKQAADRERAVSGAESSNESMDKAAAGASEFRGENAALLGTKSKEALQANDIRSSEGIGQFMALATGRDDPALVEYRKQTNTLLQLLAEQRAQRVENATILGGAAA
jgi:hypothetical protein